jgi:hypothetical protein
MLLHVRSQQTYWFCRPCWQEMPHLAQEINKGLFNLSLSLTSLLK